MAFFKFRKRGDDASAPSTQASPAESVEAMRKRARQRLIGAAVLVLVGVIGFPLVFDTQPRPIAVDIPIEIPDRNKAQPLSPPPASPSAADAGTVGAADASPPAAAKPEAPVPAAAPAAVAAPAAPVAPAVTAPAAAPVAPVVPKADAKPDAKPEPKAEARPADADRAKALLDGKDPNAASGEGRFVVQVGAFADAAKAASVRLKLEKAGLKTYTHVAETKEGKRIRVRLGPFGTKAEAEKAAAKAKGLDLPASVLTL